MANRPHLHNFDHVSGPGHSGRAFCPFPGPFWAVERDCASRNICIGDERRSWSKPVVLEVTATVGLVPTRGALVQLPRGSAFRTTLSAFFCLISDYSTQL